MKYLLKTAILLPLNIITKADLEVRQTTA